MRKSIVGDVGTSLSRPSMGDRSAYLKWVKARIKNGEARGAYQDVCEFANPIMDGATQFKLARLVASMNLDELNLKPIKISIVSPTSIEHFVDILRLWMTLGGYMADIYASKFDTVFQTILDENSELYDFQPDYVWILNGYRDFSFDIEPGDTVESVGEEVQNVIGRYRVLWEAIRRNTSAFILQNNADIPIDNAYGNLEGAEPWGKVNYLRRLNVELSSELVDGATVFDLDLLSSQFGKLKWFDRRFWYHSKHAFSMDAYGVVAAKASWVINAVEGRSKKCIVLDLDNTIWGGVIGDDGMDGITLGVGPAGEAFVDFQRFILDLKNRGIILAVCSKNEEEIAKQPFCDHPDMCLQLEDIAEFVANWNNKADNIKAIAKALNIGLDSIVFVDDNPVEREQVRTNLPMVAVPELPEDPAGYITAIANCGYFETVSFTAEDRVRNSMYRQNAARNEMQGEFSDLATFLKNLEMTSRVFEVNSDSMKRVVQLINKSNQFHLTTTRYSEPEIKVLLSGGEYIGRCYTLKDKFGDNGLISVLLLKKDSNNILAVDTWVMSCRVLSRTMERFIHRDIVNLAREMGVAQIIGQYIPTPKNRLVSGLYEELGFCLIEEEGGVATWRYDVKSELHDDAIHIEYE